MSDRGRRLATISGSLSGLLAVGLAVAAFRTSSELALAQASDSLLDVVGAFVLAWTVTIGQTPRDPGHPMGHSRAEALGALGIASLSTLLAFEVGQSAILALVSGRTPSLELPLLVALSVKALVKSGVWFLARQSDSPALRALTVDARNDVAVGIVSIGGFLLARQGAPAVDAWLAIPLAGWIGWSGVGLARDNVNLLMGGAPPPSRQAELHHLVHHIPGVLAARDLRAHFLGHSLAVHVDVEVPPNLSVGEGYDLAERVRLVLEAEADVLSASVLIVPARLAEARA